MLLKRKLQTLDGDGDHDRGTAQHIYSDHQRDESGATIMTTITELKMTSVKRASATDGTRKNAFWSKQPAKNLRFFFALLAGAERAPPASPVARLSFNYGQRFSVGGVTTPHESVAFRRKGQRVFDQQLIDW